MPSLLALWAKQEEFSLIYYDDGSERNEGSHFTAEVYFDDESMALGYITIMIHIEPVGEELYLSSRASIDISELAAFREGFDYAPLHSYHLTGDQSFVDKFAYIAFVPEINKPSAGATWVQGIGFTTPRVLCRRERKTHFAIGATKNSGCALAILTETVPSAIICWCPYCQ